MSDKAHFFKADPIGDKEELDSITFVFDVSVPKFKTLDAARSRYQFEGDRLEQSLYGILPGGVYDQLLAAMLKRRASLSRVSFGGEQDDD